MIEERAPSGDQPETTPFKDTSPLLINEPPLQVLPSLAVAVGLNEAILLQQIHYWLGKTNNVRDGERWIYNSVAEWQKQLPFWSTKTIQRMFIKLQDKGFLVTANFNKLTFDRTKWYRIDHAKLTNALGQLVPMDYPTLSQPIPETTQETTEYGATSAPSDSEESSVTTVAGAKVKKRPTEITDDFRTKMHERFDPTFGADGTDERIQEAVGHKSHLNYHDKQAHVQGWLRKDAARDSAPRASARAAPEEPNGPPKGVSEEEFRDWVLGRGKYAKPPIPGGDADVSKFTREKERHEAAVAASHERNERERREREVAG